MALGGSCCSPAAPSRDAMDARKQLQGRRGAAGCVGGEISDGGSLKPGLVKKHREDDGGGGGGGGGGVTLVVGCQKLHSEVQERDYKYKPAASTVGNLQPGWSRFHSSKCHLSNVLAYYDLSFMCSH